MTSKEVVRVVREEAGILVQKMQNNPHDRGFDGRVKQLGKMGKLMALTLLEASLVGEKANDAVKAAAIAARKAKKEGKVADLYEHVPTVVLEAAGTLDAVGVPIVGAAPDVYEMGATMIEMGIDAFRVNRYNLEAAFGAVKNVSARLRVRIPKGWDSVTA